MADVVMYLGDGSVSATGTTAIAGCVSDTWLETHDHTDAMGTDGSPLAQGSTAFGNITDNLDGTVNVETDAVFGAYDLTDMYIKIYNAAGMGEGYYLIESNDSDTVTCSDTSLISGVGFVSTTAADLSVGGIGDITDTVTDLQDQLDEIGSFAADGTNNVDILINRTVNGAVTLTATLDINNITGSTTTRVKVIGANSSFESDATNLIEIKTSVLLSDGLIVPATATQSVSFINFNMNGGGIGNAEYAIRQASAGCNYYEFHNCIFHDTDNTAVLFRGADIRFMDCDFYNAGLGGSGHGGQLRANGTIQGCRFYDNLNGKGLYVEGGMFVIGVLAENNGQDGIYVGSNSSSDTLSNITSRSNGGDGVDVASNEPRIKLTNITSIENDGFGFNFNSNFSALNLMRNCHSKDNYFDGDLGTRDAAGSHCSETSTLALFEVFSSGYNISGDALLDDDSIPSSLSPLIDAGVGGTGDTIGALCAAAGGAGGTGRLMRERRHNV